MPSTAITVSAKVNDSIEVRHGGQEKRERSEVGGQRSKFRISKLMTGYWLPTPGYLSLYDLNDLDNGHFMLYSPYER